jgi:hypothetical protein
MEEELKELKEKLNSVVAADSVLQHLVFSLFDAIPKKDKEFVIEQFVDTVDRTYAKDVSLSMPKSFLSAFQEHKEVFLQLLVDAKDSLKR